MKKLDYREIGSGQLRIEISEFRGKQRIMIQDTFAIFTLDDLEQLVIDLISIRNEMSRKEKEKDEVYKYDGDE